MVTFQPRDIQPDLGGSGLGTPWPLKDLQPAVQ